MMGLQGQECLVYTRNRPQISIHGGQQLLPSRSVKDGEGKAVSIEKLVTQEAIAFDRGIKYNNDPKPFDINQIFLWTKQVRQRTLLQNQKPLRDNKIFKVMKTEPIKGQLTELDTLSDKVSVLNTKYVSSGIFTKLWYRLKLRRAVVEMRKQFFAVRRMVCEDVAADIVEEESGTRFAKRV